MEDGKISKIEVGRPAALAAAGHAAAMKRCWGPCLKPIRSAELACMSYPLHSDQLSTSAGAALQRRRSQSAIRNTEEYKPC